MEIVSRDGVSVARIRGEIDLSNADAIFSALTRASAESSTLIVDLSEVAYLDSAGVRLLFRLARRLDAAECTLRTVVPLDAPIRRVLELASLQDQIAVDETEAAAFHGTRASG